MSDFKIVFVHGYTASHLLDWYPQLATELDQLHVDYEIPDLPGYKQPHAQAWLETLHQRIEKIDKPLVLVGHSLGTRAILLYLEKYRPQVEKVFLVGAFANRLENAQRRGGEAYPDFFDHQIDLNPIKPLVGKFIVIHSQDDQSINYEQGEEIARDLGATLVTYPDRNHFSEPENAPIILSELRKELHF